MLIGRRDLIMGGATTTHAETGPIRGAARSRLAR